MSGSSDKAKGKIKEAAGDLTGDKDLQHEGKADKTGGDAKQKLSGAVDKIKGKLTGR